MTTLIAQAEALVTALQWYARCDVAGKACALGGSGGHAYYERDDGKRARDALSQADSFLEGIKEVEAKSDGITVSMADTQFSVYSDWRIGPIADEEAIKQAFAKWAGVSWADGYTLSPSLTQQYLAWRYAWNTRTPQPAASSLTAEERTALVDRLTLAWNKNAAKGFGIAHTENIKAVLAELERHCIIMPRREG